MSTTPACGLDAFSQQTLEIFASMLAEAPVRVVLAGNLVHPLTVSLPTRTLFCRSCGTDLYDLCLGALVLRNRSTISGPEEVAVVLRKSHLAVAALGPGARNLPGATRPDSEFPAVPQITWDSPEWRDATLDDVASAGERDGSGFRGISVPGVGDLGSSLLKTITEALCRGRLKIESLSEMPDAPFVRVPVEVKVPPEHPADWERLRQVIHGVKGAVEQYIECHEQKVESLEKLHRPRWTPEGVEIDAGRLHQVAIALKRGIPARIFRPRIRGGAPYRPEEELGLLAFDLGSLSSKKPALTERAVVACVRFLEESRVDSVIVAFADRVLTVKGRKPIYVHIPIVLKRAGERFDRVFWNRLSDALHRAPSLPNPACFQPLQIRTVAAEIETAVAARDYRVFNLVYFGTQAPWPDGSSDVLDRAAVDIDHSLESLEQKNSGLWITAAFVTRSLKEAGRAGGRVAKMETLGG